MRKFYSCSVGRKNTDYIEENLDRIMANSSFIMNQDTTQRGFYQDIKKGDILILKYDQLFVAYGEALEITERKDFNPWSVWAPVHKWYLFDENDYRTGTGIYGLHDATYEGAGQMATVKRVTAEYAFNKISKINQTSDLFKLLKNEINM